MRAIQPHGTKPELVVRRALRQLGYPGYRLHPKGYPGRPDIAFIGRKKAIFVHGCFWHRRRSQGSSARQGQAMRGYCCRRPSPAR